MAEQLVLSGIFVLAVSGLPGLFFGRHSVAGQALSAVLFTTGGILGLSGACAFWAGATPAPIRWNWPIPGGSFDISLDGLSAFFLAPVLLVPTLGTIYGLGYWRQDEHADSGRRLRFFYGLVTAAMALTLVAAHAIVFLVAWEIMAVCAYFLIATEDREARVREVAFVYLIAAHVSTLLLFALFSLLRGATGTFRIELLDGVQISAGVENAVFLLALIGFGLKSGLMPLHIWLPGAHAMAPSHVSALLSGVLLKVGIYGIVRTIWLFPHPPPWWGATLLTVGTISGVLGVAFALGQHDYKRLLAYHSVENIGIIAMGLGVAELGRSYSQPAWVALGLAGALLHVWNHALFKSLLFLCAGSVLHATRTREIDELGGLAKPMPVTSLCFAVGAVAICGLPPLNGFVSELFIYLGLFRTLSAPSAAARIAVAAAPILAMMGALALACFVKAFGAIFLGEPRTLRRGEIHEATWSMRGPMFVLVGCCFAIGLLPISVVPALSRSLVAFAPSLAQQAGPLPELAPLLAVSLAGLVLVVLVAGSSLYLRRTWTTESRQALTWDCGYAAPTSRIQYTSSSFAQMLVELFAVFLRPKQHMERPLGVLPGPSHYESHVDDAVLDGAVIPCFRGAAMLFGWLRILQQGRIEVYLLYIVVTLVALLLLA